MPKILVGTVYGDSPRNAAWYSLQQRFLQQTTDCDHIAFVNGPDAAFVTASHLVGRSSERDIAKREHLRGLATLLTHFRTAGDGYAGFLILDSDAFPISPGWVTRLLAAMDHFLIAAVIRYENLDVFAHPCVLFAKPSALQSLQFGIVPRTNLLENTFEELGCNTTSFFPLLRSNRLNHHPLMGAVYWSSFYHHGAGSRAPHFRASNYHADVSGPSGDARVDNALFGALNADPDGYIRSLVAAPIACSIDAP